MWTLFQLLNEKGFNLLTQKKAFIELVQLANDSIDTKLLTQDDLIALEKLSESKTELYPPFFPNEPQETHTKFQKILELILENKKRIDPIKLCSIAKKIYPDINETDLPLFWDKLILIFQLNQTYLSDAANPSTTASNYHLPYALGAVSVAVLVGAGMFFWCRTNDTSFDGEPSPTPLRNINH